jgi:hypothetical protein
VTLTGAGGMAFFFGENPSDSTMEFIMEGDASKAESANLAVGTDDTSFVRYEVWGSSGQLGFTKAMVADYTFTPAILSPAQPTHVTYLWTPATTTMKCYLNGALAGTVTGVDPTFTMPAALGALGANKDRSEPMIGTIHRVTAYDKALAESVIQSHAQAFAGFGAPPVVGAKISNNILSITLTEGISGGHYRVEYRNSFSASDPWQLLQDIPSLSGTTITVQDPTPVNTLPGRLYRATLVP